MSKPLKTIVIGTSLLEASDAVLRTGAVLAQRTGASLWVIHAYSPLLGTTGAGLDALWMEVQVKSLRKLLEDQVRRTGLSASGGFEPGQVRLVLGTPHREIVALARSVQADLIVVGAVESTHGFLGSTADRVIRKAPCPVFAVRCEATFPPTRVEVPVDLSPCSAEAFRQGLYLLGQLGVTCNETEVLFVLNPFEVRGSVHFTPQQVERFASGELSRFLAVNVPEGGSPRLARVRTGFPREEILAVIRERRVDLAVLGTHGRSGFERLMVGSVATGVLRGASCNVLVVPPEASRQQETSLERGEERSEEDWSHASDEASVPAGEITE